MVRKILFLASNPTNTGRLRLDQEVRDVEEGLKRSNERDQFELIPSFAARIDDLRRRLLEHSPQIVHFSGHGSGVDGIVLENDKGESSPVPTDALANLFELCSEHVDCVVLNACESDLQAKAISRHIPYVIGMTSSVSDDAALEFAVGFYDALGAGKSIQDAFRFGCNAIALKGIPEDKTPKLRKKKLTAAEKRRLESSYSPANDIFLDISALDDDSWSWKGGDETVLRYSVTRENENIFVNRDLGYLAVFNAGGPISPMSYLSPTRCPFRWDFPTLDFKVLNNQKNTLFLTEVVFDIDESRPDWSSLFVIQSDVQQRHAGNLLIVNEGWCDLVDMTISFNLLPGVVSVPDFQPPYRHSINVPLLTDRAEVDVTSAFVGEGVNIEQLILLTNGDWESRDVFVVPTTNGSKEKITAVEMQEREKRSLGNFQDYVGTLLGEISFGVAGTNSPHHNVKFHAYVYLANQNRYGLPKPSSASYGTVFDIDKASYQKRVQISHELQPGETDRFTVRIAVAESSSHRFRATIRDIAGQELKSLPIKMNCFVPRSRGSAIDDH
jgi:CHAT domain